MNALSVVEFFRKRPSDRTILGGRIAFGLVIALLLGLNLSSFGLTLPHALASYEDTVKYALFVFAIVPVIMGSTNLCVAKRKYIKIVQMTFGVVLILSGNFLIVSPIVQAPVTEPVVTATGSLDYASLAQTPASAKKPINVGFWLAWLGILPLLA